MKRLMFVLLAVILLSFVGCPTPTGGTSHTHIWGEWTETGDTKPPITSDCFTYGTKEEERICDLDFSHIETRWVKDESQPPLEPHNWNEDGICTVCGETLKWPDGWYQKTGYLPIFGYTENSTNYRFEFHNNYIDYINYNGENVFIPFISGSDTYYAKKFILVDITDVSFTVKDNDRTYVIQYQVSANEKGIYFVIEDFDGLEYDVYPYPGPMKEGTYPRVDN